MNSNEFLNKLEMMQADKELAKDIPEFREMALEVQFSKYLSSVC